MTPPEGYTVLDFVGFTDRGGYDDTETYMTNDLVHAGNTVWRCLVDNTTGVEPEEGATWEVFIRGETPYYGTYDTFPRPPLPEDENKFFVDVETDPRLMYTWSEEKQDYILTGGAGGADGGSVDIPLTLPAASWTGAAAPYSQTITVPQMRVGMTPFVTLTDSDTLTDAQRYAFSLLTDYDTAYAQMTFHAADLPAVDIPVTLKGIPAQEMEYVDNTVVLIVEPSSFTASTDPEYDGRYVSTIAVEGMSAGVEGGSWDIVRSGPVLTLEESEIAAHITDVKCLDGAVQIVCTEPPAARYLLKLIGTYADAAPGDVVLPNLKEWINNIESIMFNPVAYRNNFRRTYLGNIITDEQRHAIAQDMFTGMNVGSYWVTGGVEFIVADINYWIATGNDECTEPHLVIVPNKCLGSNQQMNGTDSAAGGYLNTYIRKAILNLVFNNNIKPFFGDEILTHKELLTDAISESGYPISGNWADSAVELMNEPMVYGSYIQAASNNGENMPYISTISKTQLSLFRLCPKYIVAERESYWLRDIVTKTSFAVVNNSGVADRYSASAQLGIRPVFGIIG